MEFLNKGGISCNFPPLEGKSTSSPDHQRWIFSETAGRKTLNNDLPLLRDLSISRFENLDFEPTFVGFPS